jgi:hypothetical protein
MFCKNKTEHFWTNVTVFWEAVSRILVQVYRRFRGDQSFHLQSDRSVNLKSQLLDRN